MPPTSLFLPLSRTITMLGLQKSMSLVIVYPTFTTPFCTGLLMGFFRALPRQIGEAAIVAGCSLFGSFVKMMLPSSLPAIQTVVIFTFTLILQEFSYALTLHLGLGTVVDHSGLRLFWCGDIYYSGELITGALIASIPVEITYNLFFDRFIGGITGGGVK